MRSAGSRANNKSNSMKYLTLLFSLFSIGTLTAQTVYNLGMTTEIVGNKLRVNVYVSFDMVDGLGNANLRFTYGTGIENPSLLSQNLGGGYIDINVTEPAAGQVSFNTIFFGGAAANIPVGDDPVADGLNIGTIEFDITDNSQTPDLIWANNTVVTTDGFGILTANNLNGNFNVALPVELLTFFAEKNHQVTQLFWATSSESSNAGFEVQRSQDGDRWLGLGFVKGHHHTNTRKDYNFIDRTPIKGINYYRLKQTDLDGQFTYSDIVSLNFEKTVHGKIFPNPSSDFIFINGVEPGITFQIFDQTGHRIQVGKLSSNPISIQKLSTGLYFFKTEKSSWKFIKK